MIWAERMENKKMRNGYPTKICVECGREFYINDADMEYFVQHGFAIPKKCFGCRKKAKSLMHD